MFVLELNGYFSVVTTDRYQVNMGKNTAKHGKGKGGRGSSTSDQAVNAPQPCPDDFPELVWDKILSIEAIATTAVDRIDSLDSRVCALEASQSQKLLSAKISRLEISLTRLRNEVRDIKSHSMKYNLVFTFDDRTDQGREIEGEDTVSVIRRFLCEVMNVPGAANFSIPVAHRLGGLTRGKQRAILAKFPVAVQRDLILRHGNRLANTRHGVSKQCPPSMKERTHFAMDTFKAKRADPNNKARLNNGKLFVKGKVQTSFLEPDLPQSVPDAANVDMAVTDSEQIKDSGSTFQAYAAKVTSLSDITTSYDKIITQPGVADVSHCILAYRIQNGGKPVENFRSDDDHGMGLDLLRLLRERNESNVMCMVTRQCSPGFVHLGSKRFEHLRKTGNVAIDKLKK